MMYADSQSSFQIKPGEFAVSMCIQAVRDILPDFLLLQLHEKFVLVHHIKSHF